MGVGRLALAGAIDGLRTWAYAHMEDIDAAREQFDTRPTAPGPPTGVTPAP